MMGETSQEVEYWKGKFSQIPAWVICFGAWEQMRGRAAKVFIFLCHSADNKTKICMPTQKRISEKTGVGFNSVSDITRELVVLGVIKKWRHGFRTHYQVQFAPPQWVVDRGYPKGGNIPRNSRIYLRDGGTGKFVADDENDLIPKNPQVSLPNNSGEP